MRVVVVDQEVLGSIEERGEGREGRENERE